MDNTLKIINIFKSIDGEAYHSGKATLFLRTFGCNLKCHYSTGSDSEGCCDTPESLTLEGYRKVFGDKPLAEMTPDEAFEACQALNSDRSINHITITGGEPLLPCNQPWMKEFALKMLSAGYDVDFETNGAVDYTEMVVWRNQLDGLKSHLHFIMDWKCPGSGMNRYMHESNLLLLSKDLDVLKCVCKDGDLAEVERILPRASAPIYISPCWGQIQLLSLADFAMKYAQYGVRVQFQIHKLIYGADDRFH